MKYILITGSPSDGFDYEGPFDDPTTAGEFARKTFPRNSKYWIAPIREPEEDDKMLETKLDILENDYDEFENKTDSADTPGIDDILRLLRMLDEKNIPL